MGILEFGFAIQENSVFKTASMKWVKLWVLRMSISTLMGGLGSIWIVFWNGVKMLYANMEVLVGFSVELSRRSMVTFMKKVLFFCKKKRYFLVSK